MMDKNTRLLSEFLDSPERPDGTFSFHELQGLLFAIASSPETIAPSEWLPLISNDVGLEFVDENKAQRILGLLMVLYNEVNTAVLDRSNALPSGCEFEDDVVANFEDGSSISQWSRGFTAGHEWLAKVWEEYVFDELDEEYCAILMVLSFFGSRQLAAEYHADVIPIGRDQGKPSFEELAKTVRAIFPEALASYANLGRTIFEVVSQRGTSSREPATSTKVGRNTPCPCGSGKKYKKCCGN